MLMDNFAILMHLFNCLPTLHLASQPYMPRMQPALPLDAHYKSGRLKASAYPLSIAPNVYILTSPPSTVTTGITLICPGETTQFITVQKPIHILWLPPTCNATSPHFHLPPWYEPPKSTVNISLDIANLNMVTMSSLDFHIWQHLEDQQNETQLHHLSSSPLVPITQLYKHMISGNEPVFPLHHLLSQ